MREGVCGCAICQNNHPFDIPEGLVDDVMKGRVALFVGAGVSTENSNVIRYSLYEAVAAELGLQGTTQPFSDLMTKFCVQRDGRLKLVKTIQDRFHHIKSFAEMYDDATRFHREFATFFPIDTIVTTNWDRFFEDECFATPFIYDSDMALWDAAQRKVLKLHGGIENVGSLVATTNDYAEAQERLVSGMIGAKLKTILAEKTLIYLGYSHRDSDLNYINQFVATQLGELSKEAFVVTLDDSPEARERYSAAKLCPIFTDATYFLACLKEHAVANYCFLPDQIYDKCLELLGRVVDAHEWLYAEFNLRRHPAIMYCAYYQDGLQHLLKRTQTLRGFGAYSDRHRMLAMSHHYEDLRKEYLREKRYGDVAYVEGYLNGIFYVLTCTKNKVDPPLYYALGIGEIESKTAFRRLLPQMSEAHKAGAKYAEKIVAKFAANEKLVLHHRPEL